ncbi:hypothetical protein, partial [Escherichia coli]|uniref:hypothetical protein n=1 Tax=Escherichia coli TaxID=562 RepID=UPI0022B744F1
ASIGNVGAHLFKLVGACYGAKTLSAEPRRSFSNELNFKWLNWLCNQEPLLPVLPGMKWFTEFGHLNRGDMLTSEQHRCHNEKKKFQRRV